MKLGETYSKNQIDKLGNALIFFCERVKPTSKTHLLKLVFIIEEISIKKYGVPFFDLRFDLWKLGPVSKDLFVELSDEPNLLADYIAKENSIIVAKRKFNDDEFSDLEINLLNEVSERFKYCTAGELINFTHRKDTPWYNTAIKHGMLEILEKGKKNTTDIEIDMSQIIENDEQKLSFYKEHKDFLSFSNSLKS